MILTVQSLEKNIYLENYGTLASRIDYAWSIYQQPNHYKTKDRTKAFNFLMYAFDIHDVKQAHSLLNKLMDDRKKHENKNPEYVPSKIPEFLPFNPVDFAFERKKNNSEEFTEEPEIKQAILNGELLIINDDSKNMDNIFKIKKLSPQERGENRINIHNGLFKKNNCIFDTSDMSSHEKKGYAAYTLNIYGELSLFNHNMKRNNRICHSSMNDSSPIVAAGELKIANGKLESITTYSGHYKPSIFNVYRTLDYFTDHGVDISKTHVISEKKVMDSSKNICLNGVGFFQTPAKEIYTELKKAIKTNLDSIEKQIKTYTSENLTTSLFQLKDKIIGSSLTKKRNQLAIEFEQAINMFKADMKSLLPEQIKIKKEALDTLINQFEKRNAELSKEYNKTTSNGRLATKMADFKKQLKVLNNIAEPVESINMKNKF